MNRRIYCECLSAYVYYKYNMFKMDFSYLKELLLYGLIFGRYAMHPPKSSCFYYWKKLVHFDYWKFLYIFKYIKSI